MKPTLNRFFGYFATVVACISLSAGAAMAEKEGLLMPVPAKPAPIFTYVDENGAAAAPNAHAGKVVLVHFWAKWCPPCIDELPKMVAMIDSIPIIEREDLVVLPISLDRDPETVRAFLKENDIHLPIMRDEGSKAMRALQIKGLPSTVLIDRSGDEVARREGVVDWQSAAARGIIMETLHPTVQNIPPSP